MFFLTIFFCVTTLVESSEVDDYYDRDGYV